MYVILRMDDIVGYTLKELKKWFNKFHPDIPVCVYACATNSRWNREDWKVMKFLIENKQWEIGGHTRNHPCLPLLNNRDLEEEIIGNIQDIERGLKEIGLTYKVKSFAYPLGEYDERVQNILKGCGVSFGLTYPDAFPYKSIFYVSQLLNNPFSVGVTQTGEGSLECWNRRFNLCKKLSEKRGEEGVYILALHPRYWTVSIARVIWSFIKNHSLNTLAQEAGAKLFGSKVFPTKWNVLNEHIKYIKTFKQVKFTTFQELDKLYQISS